MKKTIMLRIVSLLITLIFAVTSLGTGIYYAENISNTSQFTKNNTSSTNYESVGDMSQAMTVAMEVYSEDSGIEVSYLDYFHTDQVKLENGFSITFENFSSGDYYVNLIDQDGNIVGTSPVYTLNNVEYFNPNIYINDNITPGDYGLEVFKNGEKINNGPIYEVPVTDTPIIVNVLETYAQDGRSAVEGDTELYFQIEGYGIQNTDEITVNLFDSNDKVIAQSTESKIIEENNNGKVKSNYKLEVTEGNALIAGEGYTVNFESSDGRRIIKDTFLNDSYTPNTYKTIYSIDIINGMKGEVSLKLSNLEAGTYDVVFKKQEGWHTIDTFEVNNVEYNGLGVLDIEVKDNTGNPVILDGTYDVVIKEESSEITNYYLTVKYDDEMYGDYYSEMTILDIEPIDLNSSNSGDVNASGDIANISEGNVTLELVEVDDSGQVIDSVSSTDELSYYEETQDADRYRFGNQYEFTGTINVSGISKDKNYKWKISGLDNSNEESYFVYPKEINVGSSPKADNIRITNGVPLAGEGHSEDEIVYADEYYVSLNGDMEFSIDQPALMDDLSKVDAKLLDSSDSVVGTLKEGTIDSNNGIITGEISLNTQLSNNNDYVIIITYDGIEAGSIIAKAINTEGAKSISIDEYDNKWVFSSGSEFKFELEDVINLDLSDIEVILERLTDGSGITLDVDTSQNKGDLIFSCEAETDLSGYYILSILYDNEPVNLLYYDEFAQVLTSDIKLEEKVIYFEDDPYVTNTEYCEGNYIFNGSGFSSSKSYKAVLYKDSQLIEQGDMFNLDYSSSTTLVIPEEEFEELSKGEYQVYILENGEIIPSTLDIELVLASEEVNIVQPVVKINNGAENTNSENVTLNINGGTFNRMKIADSIEGLSLAEYTEVQGTVEYTLTGGYGENTVYFRFIDDNGLESDLITASINYISSTLPVPLDYGISNPEMKNGQRITLWIESPYIPAEAEVVFKDEEGTTINTVTLPRTLILDGVNTYSKIITIDETFLGADKAQFYIKDKITGAYSPVQNINISFDDNIFIDHTHTNIDLAYLTETYVVQDGEIRLSMVGSPNMEASSEITYEKNGDEIIKTVAMDETTYPGRYYAETIVPEDAEYIKSIKYILTSNLTETSQVYEETIDKAVAATLEFTGLDNDDGQYNGMQIIIEDKIQNYKRSIKLTGQPRLIFFALEAGEYNYYITDYKRNYETGTVLVSDGKEVLVSLENAKQPAQLTLNIIGEGAGGYIEYIINEGEEDSRTEYLYIGQKLEGLLRGDTVKCSFRLDYSTKNKYIQPDTQEIEIAENNMDIDIHLTELEKVTLIGKVIESAVGRDGKNAAIEGANIYLSQEVTNEGYVFYNNESVTTDENGSFSIIVFKDFKGEISIRKPGYDDLIADLSKADTSKDKNLTDYKLDYRDSKIINIKLFNAPITEAGETAEYYPSSVEKLKDIDAYRGEEKIFGDFDRYNGKLYFYDDTLNTGDTITLEAEGRDIIVEGNRKLELNKYLGGEVTFYSKDYGQIKANVENEQYSDRMCYMLIFKSDDGELVKYYSGTGKLVTAGSYLKQGSYTAIFLSGEELTNVDKISKLDTLNNFYLVENLHYIKKEIQVNSGEYTNIGNVAIPDISNDDIGYFSPMGTSINAKIDKVTENGDVRAKVTVKASMLDRYIIDDNKLSSMQIVISGGYIENNEFFLNGEKFIASKPKYIYKNISGSKSESTISFYAILSNENTLEISAIGNLSIEGTKIIGDIGSKMIQLPALTIKSPEEVVADEEIEILVKGFGYKGSEIEILDNDNVVGKAKVGERGKWKTYINLTNPEETGFHILKARIIDGEEEIISNLVYTQVLSSTAPRLSDITISQRGNFSIRMEDVADSVVDIVATINPYKYVDVKFKILNADKDDIEYTGLVNEKDGVVSTIITAEFNDETGYWEGRGKLLHPGELSILFALKEHMDISYMTGSSPINVEELPDNANVDPAYLPPDIRDAHVEVTNDGSDGGDTISATATVENETDTLNISFKGTHSVVDEPPADARFFRLQTNQGAYYTSAPEVIEYPNGDIEIIKTVYFERDLFNKIIGEEMVAGLGIPEFEKNIYKSIFKNSKKNNLTASLAGDFQTYNVAVTKQDVLDKCDYSTYVGGAADFVISTSKNPNALGKLGGAMDVFGGAVLVGQALLGRIGKDPADLRKAASLIKSSRERKRIYNFIDEYAKATRNSHYVNTFMGGVSYGSSFFGPLGKGLSYVISTGGQVFGKKIGDEYEIWADSIIKMIKVELTKEKRKIGKKKKISYPKWKIDPSGYVFEAIQTNRIKDVTATALVKDGEDFRVWNEAEEWNEENPVTTDSEGKYGWDVPEGEWKVKFEKDGYETYETKSMTVPPMHDQVNIGLLSTQAPNVEEISIYPDGAEIEFDMYMRPESIENCIQIKDSDGNNIPIREVAYVKEADNTGYTGEGDYSDIIIPSEKFVKVVKIIPDTHTGTFNLFAEDGETAAQYNIIINNNVVSYSGIAMEEDYNDTISVEERQYYNVTSIDNPESKTVPVGISFNSLKLPTYVTVTLDNDSSVDLLVRWNKDTFNGNVIGNYSITGELDLTDEITNTLDIKAVANITVGSEDINNDDDDDNNNNNNSGKDNKTEINQKANIDITKDSEGYSILTADIKSEVIDGKVTAALNKEHINDILSGSDNEKKTLKFDISVPKESEQLTTVLSKDALELITGKINMCLSTKFCEITFDDNSTQSIKNQADNDISISLEVVNTDELSSDIKAQTSDRPVLDIDIESGDKEITQFNEGKVNISIPYEIKSNEDASSIIVYYIDKNGNLIPVKASGYDREKQSVSFTVNHLSRYGVGYKEISFSDINMWAKDSIKYLAARGIVSGAGNGEFKPNRTVTRAEFTKMLIESIDGLNLKTDIQSPFDDVNDGDWYKSYVIWAVENKVVSGYGDGTFKPSDKITREQMAVMINNFASTIELHMPDKNSNKIFIDNDEISLWAKDSVSKVQMAGIINGKPGDKFDPKGFATRAEASKVIEGILKILL